LAGNSVVSLEQVEVNFGFVPSLTSLGKVQKLYSLLVAHAELQAVCMFSILFDETKGSNLFQPIVNPRTKTTRTTIPRIINIIAFVERPCPLLLSMYFQWLFCLKMFLSEVNFNFYSLP